MAGDFEFDDEATAVVSLADMRAAARPAQAKYHLLVHAAGTELGRVRVLGTKETLIGRHTEADIWLNDDGVSRKHAKISHEGDGYVVYDLGSANGTFVQREKITRRVLADGELIQLGPTAVFRYSVTDEDQKNLLEQLYSTSVTDALTGARNREYMDSLLTTELSYARRHDQDLGFVLFDLDHFKSVNDTYGHPAGDAVLIEVSRAVRGEVRAEDCLCRYGGEEFGLVLRSADLAGALAMGERVRSVIEHLVIHHEDLVLRITASIGCATLRELPDATPNSLVELADKRLYLAKRSGRNRVVGASQS